MAEIDDAVPARLEEAVDRFEDLWQRGERPAIDDHLSDGGDGRAALLVELVHVDLEYRLKAGEPVRVEAYLERYPELSRDRGVLVDLLAAEWRLRRRADPSVDIEEYARRFPDCRDDLAASATMSFLPVRDVTPQTDGAHTPVNGAADGAPGGVATRSRYRILQLHARGGLGEILAARDEELHREVALKRLQPQLAGSAERRSRFLREAEITSQLEHPGVVPVYGLGHDADGNPVYAMRLIRGETFQQAVDRFHRGEKRSRSADRRLAFRQLLTRFVSVCNTVAYAHNRGILHRDLKPGNILLGSYGETLVVDWGLAKPVAGAEAAPATAAAAPGDSDLTQAGDVVGTPAYMSPEQAEGRWDAVGPASDVHSLGATLYVLLTGRPPFGPGTVGEVLEKVRRGVFPRPRQVNRRVSPALEAVCMKAMAPRPQDRYGSALAMAADLEKWLAGEPVAARREPVAARVGRWMRRHVTFVTTSVLLLASCAVVGVLTALWLTAAERAKAAKEAADLRARDVYLFHVAAAGREWWAARFDLAAQHLAACEKPEELHGWEWNYLTRCTRACEREQLLTLKGHEKEAWNVVFSPDGTTLASASLDGTVRVWDAADGHLLFKLEGHKGPAWAVAFSPDGDVLATGGDDRTVRLWDAKSGRPLRTFEAAVGPVFGLAYSHDGRILAAAVAPPNADRLKSNTVGGEMDLWDMPAGTPREPLRTPSSCPTGAAFSPDDHVIAAGALDGTVRRWEVASEKELDPLTGPKGAIQAVAISSDGLWIASASSDGRVCIWDAHTGAMKHLWLGHAFPGWGASFSPDGRRLATSGDDAAVRLWDVPSGRRLFTLYGHVEGIANVTFSPDGARLASASDDQTVRVWDAQGVATDTVLCGHKNHVWGFAFSPDGRLVASAGGPAPNDENPEDDAAVRVWDADGKELIALHVPGGANGVAWGAGGRFLAAAGADGTVRVWDTEAGWEEHALGGHDDKALAVAFSPDGKWIASASADKTVKLWDVSTWTEARTLRGHEGVVRCVVFSPDGKRIASGGDDRTVKLWDPATGALEQTLSGWASAARALAFSPDGKRLAIGTAMVHNAYTHEIGEILLWDLEKGAAALTLQGHVQDVTALAFSPDGKRLASGGSDRWLILWDPATGQELLPIYGAHMDCINALAFSPDGKRLASASCDRTVTIWDGAPP